MPYFGEHVKNIVGKSKRKLEKSGGWGLGGPSFVKPNPQGGITMFPLLPQSLVRNESKTPVKPKAPKPIRPRKGTSAHKKLHANPHPILAECSKLLGQTMYGKQSECDSSSMTPLVTVSGHPKKRESKLNIRTARFRESSFTVSSEMPSKFRVVLIEEGMGNSSDAFYYTREALESAIDVFNGLKIMADHPTETEDQIRPERSTKDILGHYENLAVEDGKDGQGQLCADVDILDCANTEWARACMVRAVENSSKFPGRDFIGLSINASGPSEETQIADVIKIAPDGAKQKLVDAQAEGIEVVKVVTKINRAVSCDLVTEAGAGGKIQHSIEGDTDGQKTA